MKDSKRVQVSYYHCHHLLEDYRVLFLKNDFIYLPMVVRLVLAAQAFFHLQCSGFSLYGFSCCSLWAQQLRLIGLVAPRHVESSHTRDMYLLRCR